MTYSQPRLCRVSLHAENGCVDLALPAGVPIAALLPSILDITDIEASRPSGRRAERIAAPYRLARPGEAALDGSKTLAQHAIRDGSVLLLARTPDGLAAPRFDDPVERVSAAVRTKTQPWTPRAARCASGLAAGWLAAVAGFVAVPGGPGAPNALLAAAAAATAAVLVMQLGAAGPAVTAFCCLAVMATAAALTGVLAQVAPRVIAATATALAVALLPSAARLAIMLTGSSLVLEEPSRGNPDARAAAARQLLTALVTAFSAVAALGTLGTAIGAHAGGGPRFGGIALAAVAGLALLLRARAHTDRYQITALVTGGIGALSVAVLDAAATAPQHRLWLSAAAAVLGTGALRLGFGREVLSPVARHAAELLEYPVLAAVLPVAGWVCGWYGAARGLNPA